MHQHRVQHQQHQQQQHMLQQSSGGAASFTAAREAYVDIRVCDLIIQQGTMPNTIDGGFQIDGLYIVLRCQNEVRRTSCLWPSAATADDTAAQQLRNSAAGDEDADEDDLVWNELFRFAVPPEQPAAARQPSQPPTSPQDSHGGGSAGFAAATAPYTPPLAPRDGSLGPLHGGVVGPYSAAHAPPPSPPTGLSTPPQRSASQAPPHANPDGTLSPSSVDSGLPLRYPAIELELWRSTPLSEHLLGRYTYYVPTELLQGGYNLAHLDAVAERVVRLRTKEASSIMGNLYGWSGHRLSVRLRVQAVGLAALPPAVWMSTAQNAAYATGAGGPPAASVGMYPGQYPPAVYLGANMGAAGPPLYGPGAGNGGSLYGAPMGTLNPVLANLLAPLGVSAPGPGGGYGPIPSGTGMPPWHGGHRGAGSGGGGVGGLPPATSGQAILGDGDSMWQPSAAPPAMFPPYGQHQQPR